MLAHPDADTACLPAYKLGVCLPADNNRVNRAKVERDAANHLVSIVEQYDICLVGGWVEQKSGAETACIF